MVLQVGNTKKLGFCILYPDGTPVKEWSPPLPDY